MWCRGIRGATTVDNDTVDDILRECKELLQMMIDANGVKPEDVACAIFTTTSDLNSAFPATAARQLGWTDVPLMCSKEIDVPGSVKGCIRLLILYNTERSAEDIVHIYIKGASNLRSDSSGTR
ncbi:MAG: chorismate mutase [Dehalococcoidia bacterium]|nr:MAG: chorismate mutase [Dehalococcoidia bacterium]